MSRYTWEELSKLTVPELQVLIRENKWKIRRSKLRKAEYIANIIAATTPQSEKPLEKPLEELAKVAAVTKHKPKTKKKKVVRWHPLTK
jgi:hypothetical protein